MSSLHQRKIRVTPKRGHTDRSVLNDPALTLTDPINNLYGSNSDNDGVHLLRYMTVLDPMHEIGEFPNSVFNHTTI